MIGGLYFKQAGIIYMRANNNHWAMRDAIREVYYQLISEGEAAVAQQLEELGYWLAFATLYYDELTADEMASAILSMQCPEARS